LQGQRTSLRAAITDIMRQFAPDTVVTFGPDGGYGHPDHVAISEQATEAFRALVRDHDEGQRLYHAVFPPRPTSMAEELALWIVSAGRRAVEPAALRAIALFAGESTTMRLARDDVRVEWFPPGLYVVEQGEQADALYLILNGIADALREQPDGQVIHLSRMQAGDFFGELGLVADSVRTAHVVALESLTCLVLSRTPVTLYAGRGVATGELGVSSATAAPAGMCEVDVTDHLSRKLQALARHRTQYPIVSSMFPQRLLEQMLGTEFFVRTADGNPE
jgi:CRP-like cAMP-binding protein